MKTRELLTDAQRTFFYEIPSQTDERELIRYYTLSDEELRIVGLLQSFLHGIKM